MNHYVLLEVGNVHFCGGRKTEGVPEETPQNENQKQTQFTNMIPGARFSKDQ